MLPSKQPNTIKFTPHITYYWENSYQPETVFLADESDYTLALHQLITSLYNDKWFSYKKYRGNFYFNDWTEKLAIYYLPIAANEAQFLDYLLACTKNIELLNIHLCEFTPNNYETSAVCGIIHPADFQTPVYPITIEYDAYNEQLVKQMSGLKLPDEHQNNSAQPDNLCNQMAELHLPNGT